MYKPIRVLQVFALMNRGGAETMIMNIYRNLDRTKIQFDFVVHTEEVCDFDDEIKLLGGRIYRIPRYEGKNHLQYLNFWADFFRNNPDYKIIHGHIRSTASIYLNIARKFGLITIAHSHSTSSGGGIEGIVKGAFQYPIRHFSDYLFACSEGAGMWLYGKNVLSRKNFFVVNNAIDSELFAFNEATRLEKRLNLRIEKKLVFGHVGRFISIKNHQFLIDIFKEIHSMVPGSVLLLIGDGELKPEIEKYVKEKKLNNEIFFLGIREDIPQLLCAMDMFIFPSIYEGLPVTLIEAQAAGLKMVISDSITKEVAVTNLVSYCSLDSDPKQWASFILKKTFSEKQSREKYYEVIKTTNYDIKDNSKWIENFYLNVLKGRYN